MSSSDKEQQVILGYMEPDVRNTLQPIIKKQSNRSTIFHKTKELS